MVRELLATVNCSTCECTKVEKFVECTERYYLGDMIIHIAGCKYLTIERTKKGDVSYIDTSADG